MARGAGNNDVGAVLQHVVKFPTYSPGGVTMFDFVVVLYNGSKWYTGSEVRCLRLRYHYGLIKGCRLLVDA